jgi:hypothetical protein
LSVRAAHRRAVRAFDVELPKINVTTRRVELTWTPSLDEEVKMSMNASATLGPRLYSSLAFLTVALLVAMLAVARHFLSAGLPAQLAMGGACLFALTLIEIRYRTAPRRLTALSSALFCAFALVFTATTELTTQPWSVVGVFVAYSLAMSCVMWRADRGGRQPAAENDPASGGQQTARDDAGDRSRLIVTVRALLVRARKAAHAF